MRVLAKLLGGKCFRPPGLIVAHHDESLYRDSAAGKFCVVPRDVGMASTQSMRELVASRLEIATYRLSPQSRVSWQEEGMRHGQMLHLRKCCPRCVAVE